MFAWRNRISHIVARVRNIALQLTHLSEVAVIIKEVLLALNKTIFGVCSYDFLDVRCVIDCCHNMIELCVCLLIGSIISNLPRTNDVLTAHLSQTYHALNFVQRYEK